MVQIGCASNLLKTSYDRSLCSGNIKREEVVVVEDATLNSIRQNMVSRR